MKNSCTLASTRAGCRFPGFEQDILALDFMMVVPVKIYGEYVCRVQVLPAALAGAAATATPIPLAIIAAMTSPMVFLRRIFLPAFIWANPASAMEADHSVAAPLFVVPSIRNGVLEPRSLTFKRT
jgi:hypothetical protein